MRKLCLDKVHELAQRDNRVMYIGSDPGAGTLAEMQLEFPDRFLIEGIAEQNVVGMAAGLAMEGFIPYVNTIATFLTRRCFEQVAIDLCLHDLPVRLIGNGGGFVYAPLGPTHTAVEDIAIMRALPNMTVVAVADAEEMGRFMEASLEWKGPIYIRLAKGYDPVVTKADWGFKIGKGIVTQEGGDILMVSTGIMLGRMQQAANKLVKHNIDCTILHMPTVKPLDTKALLACAKNARLVVTGEEHTLIGGLGSAVLEALSDAGGPMPAVTRLGIKDTWTHHYGSQNDLMRDNGLDADSIVAKVRQVVARL